MKRYIELFLQYKYHIADVDIEEIVHEFISDFEFYLPTEKKWANNTAVKYVKNPGKIIRNCISNKWIDHDRLLGHKFKSKKVDCYLTKTKAPSRKS
ncbi:MAG: phage integrase SAM-like domain-containing protein [Sphingobacteriales bacterium]